MRLSALFLLTLMVLLASTANRTTSVWSAAPPTTLVEQAGQADRAGTSNSYLPLITTRSMPFTYFIDDRLTPTQPSLPGLDGGPSRPVEVVVGPGGERMEFVANEVMFHPESPQHLDTFLAKYRGVTVRDGTPFVVSTSESPPVGQIASSGWYLIRIDPSRSTLADLPPNMEATGAGGAFTFSSDAAVRLVALVAREAQQHVYPNLLAYVDAIPEHPDGMGGNIDAATFWWLTEDDDPTTAGNQGLSIGVVRAWDYLRYMGLPPTSGSWQPSKVAIIDGGFDLDERTGYPLNGNIDYFFGTNPPFQADAINRDRTAGGRGGCENWAVTPWHGQLAFGVAAAYPGNSFGTAGTGGEVVRPMLYKADCTAFGVTAAIRGASLSGADVINLSLNSGTCGGWAWLCKLSDGEFDIYAAMQQAVHFANANGSVVVASASNGATSLDNTDIFPCKLKGVICVGSIDQAKMNVHKYGSAVDIWAPTRIRSTITRESAAVDADNVGIDELAIFGGTSASAPFVAGVVGLMKALDPSLQWHHIERILQETANSSPDPKVTRGYVDAFQAVARVKPNRSPAVNITFPSHGASVAGGSGVGFTATATDPETPARFGGAVAFFSDRDGKLCDGSDIGAKFYCLSPRLSLGTHTITARATDPFDATASASITIEVISDAPTATITYPSDGATFFTSQTINFRGFGSDDDSTIGDSDLLWRSDRDGILGSGYEIDVRLSQGMHRITLAATDAYGLVGEHSISINVLAGDDYPTARIIDVIAGSPSGNPFTFMGQGSDPEDGWLPDASLAWFSDRDGFLGTGGTRSVVLSGPVVGLTRHTITLRVTDSDGHQATHAVNVTVGLIE